MLDYQNITLTIPLSTANIAVGIALLISLLVILFIIIKIIWNRIGKTEELKYEFITIIAHKFRTPLTYVKWATSELLGTEQDNYRKENLKNIAESNEKLITLTGTLIDLTENTRSTASTYNFEQVSLTQFTRTVAEAFKNLFHEKNIFFAINIPQQEILVKIDVSRMEFVVQTLLENARTYTPTGRNVQISVTETAHHAIISVADAGIGIEKEDMANVFSKFFRAPNAQSTDTEGFGVGLYLAKSIVERHKGKIAVYSNGKDAGSIFAVTLRKVH